MVFIQRVLDREGTYPADRRFGFFRDHNDTYAATGHADGSIAGAYTSNPISIDLHDVGWNSGG
jgi:hypothetical protein